jgi:hypothetical protein
LKIMVPFYHFHWSSKNFVTFCKTLLSTHLTLSSLKINKEKLQTSKSCNFIGHITSFLHTRLFNTLYILVHNTITLVCTLWRGDLGKA